MDEVWEFCAMPWTWTIDTPQRLSDGWEPIAVAVIGQIGDAPTTCLIARRRVDDGD